MSAKTKWVESGDVLYEVAAPEQPEESEVILAGRNDGSRPETPSPAVDLHALIPRVQASDGEFLARTGPGIKARWAIVKLACGAHPGESCGCGCNHGHAATVLSPETAAAWLLRKGVPRESFPADVKAALEAITV